MSRRMGLAFIAALLGCLGVRLLPLPADAPESRDYSLIEDGLYLGSAVDRPPPGTRAVVNLCGRPDPYPVEASLWVPIYEDGPVVAGQAPTLDLVRRVVGFIEGQRRAGRTTYVHCMIGVNRSATMVTAYVMREQGLGRDAALDYVRQRRPEISPDPTLLKLLGEWERALR